MSAPIRTLVLTVALGATLGCGIAAAQTVVVRKAPPGSPVEVMVNANKAGTATVNPSGDASVSFSLPAVAGGAEIDANVSVDVCGKLYRVWIVARGTPQALPDAGCERRTVAALFLVRRVTTLVVNVDSIIPSVLLIQGSFDLTTADAPPRTWRDATTGLVLFGAAGRGTYGDAVDRACGTVSPCSGEGEWGALTAGVDFWMTPFFAATGTFVKPAQLDITGSGETFEFDSFLDAYVLTVGGKVGLPIGPLRAYGHAGATYHGAVFGTTQINEDVTATIDGVEQTVPGGTQAFELKTSGWGLTFGGGLEAWLTRSFALYGDVTRLGVKGDAGDEEGSIDDNLLSIGVGVRVRLGGG
jgi:hypothetical protein